MYPLNLTIAAKIRWRMACDRNPLHVTLQDKLAVKRYAAGFDVPTAEVLFQTDHPEKIPFGELPEKCFIKANHGCNWNILKYGRNYYNFINGEEIISEDGFYRTDQQTNNHLEPSEIIKICNEWLNQKYRPVEWAYNDIKPMIFGEQIIEPAPGMETLDYRLFTFRGKVAAISIGSPSMRKKNENIFFDPNWNKITLVNNFENEPELLPEKPFFLEEMVEATERLCSNTDFLRIDFFADQKRYYLSEVTIYPNGGQDNRPTSDEKFNLYLGTQWKMNIIHWFQARKLEWRHQKEIKKAKIL
jgi:hypothetical protein